MKYDLNKLMSLGIIILSLNIFFAGTTGAEHINKLQGESFSDPSYHVDMPEEWMKQQIKYDKWAEDADLSVTLDQHLYPAYVDIIKKYAKEQNLKIAVNEGTCGTSAGMLSRKKVDMAGFCCPPGKTDRLASLRYHTIAISALALFIHPDNPVDNVTLEEAQKIYQGKIYRWSELKTADGRPGPDKPIQAIARLHCKLRPGHWRSVLDNEDLFSRRMKEVGSIQDEILQIASNQWAVGAAETLYMEGLYRKGRKLKALKINGYSPSKHEDLISGKYPMYFVYNVTTWEGMGVANPRAQKLLDHMFEQIDNVDGKFHMVPAQRLRKAGWKFKDNELIGGPE